MDFDVYKNLKKIKIKGLGDKTISVLKRAGIVSLVDLFFTFPKTYDDKTNIKKIRDIKEGESVVLQGEIIRAERVRTRSRRSLYKAVFKDDSGMIELVWFGMNYISNTIKKGEKFYIIGEVKRDYSYKIVNPEYSHFDEDGSFEAKIDSVYTLPFPLRQKSFRAILKNAIKNHIDKIEEVLPHELIEKYGLKERKEAFYDIHFPKNMKDIEESKRRFAVEELFLLEISIVKRRFLEESKNSKKYKLEGKKELVKKYLENLDFELTKAQKKVITEIYKEFSNGKIVNRLIQGDVGSGKTVVAIAMLLYIVENGYQGVLMCPTEILAEQHYLEVYKTLETLGIRVGFLTGNIKGKKRNEVLKKIESGEVDIVVGTHALIEGSVKFKNLGLIIIDEQHKFGVKQREELKNKGVISNLIVMTATPIPRSLALTIYGDLDVSIIDELPPGRQPIKTKWIAKKGERTKVYNYIKKHIKMGEQAYVVCPLIEESETLNVNSVEEVYEELVEKFSDYRVGLLHGKMKKSEKESVMQDFKNRDYDVLVSTTVIEVGVNVPNSTIMVIEDANRFGLAQLHQIRGRVGRGEKKSYCFLIAETENENSISRMKVMEAYTDGFVIAEEDLKLRKSGEIFGTRQSGISDLRFSDIIRDIKTIKLARDEAYNYLEKTGGKIEGEALRYEVENLYSLD